MEKMKRLFREEGRLLRGWLNVPWSLKDKREDGRKLMMKMIHNSLPLYQKFNRLVIIEKQNNKSTFYQNKYDKYTNEGLCPCCR